MKGALMRLQSAVERLKSASLEGAKCGGYVLQSFYDARLFAKILSAILFLNSIENTNRSYHFHKRHLSRSTLGLL